MGKVGGTVGPAIFATSASVCLTLRPVGAQNIISAQLGQRPLKSPTKHSAVRVGVTTIFALVSIQNAKSVLLGIFVIKVNRLTQLTPEIRNFVQLAFTVLKEQSCREIELSQSLK